jgi:threonine/homoserine/homoserine lactone efflux protein
MDPLTKGFVLGFSIAAPVGPIGLLCIRRSVTDGRLAGICVGFGAATADALYGIVAGLGLSAVTATLLAYQTTIQLIGGAFLVFLGVSIARSKGTSASTSAGAPTSRSVRNSPAALWAAYASTLLLTLSNPATILSFIGILAGAGLNLNASGRPTLVLFIAGVFLGSMTWWLVLSSTASWLGAKWSSLDLRWINRTTGGLLIGFGFWQFVRLASLV